MVSPEESMKLRSIDAQASLRAGGLGTLRSGHPT
jgi:hypothetical protein